MPRSYVRLSAGRTDMSDEMQAMCFFAGANSIFCGDSLLTADNPGEDKDSVLFKKLGLEPEELKSCSDDAHHHDHHDDHDAPMSAARSATCRKATSGH